MVGFGLRLVVGFVNPCQSWLGSWVGVFGLGLWCCPSFAGCLWCSWLGFGVGLLSGRVWFRVRFPCPPPFPVPACGVGVRAGPGSRLCPALLGWVVGVCFLRFFFFSFARCPCPGPCGLSPRLLSFGLGCWLFFFFVVCVCLFRCPFSWWAAVPGLVLPVLAGWSPCASLGVLSSVPSGWGVWPPSVLLAGGLVAVGFFRAAPPYPPPLFFGGGGGGGLAVFPFAFPWLVLALWLLRGVVGPSPLLAEVPVCYSSPLLAGFCCRWWWAVPATPGWGPLAAVVCGVWCVAVVCWWGCGWCVVWLVPRHSWRWFVCATPRHSWLVFAAGGGGWSPPLLAGVRWRRCCVVCGVWRWCVGGVVAGVWCGWSPPLLAGVRWRRWCVVCGVWCVVCGGGVLVGSWLVCGVVVPSPLLAEVPVCYSPPLLAGFRCPWWWAVPATPGWGPLAAVVCGVWCVVCGGGVLLGLWLVCGVVGPSPLLAEVPVCYSPPLLAGFRCRWWWAVPATPGWGPLAAVVCGVWCVAVVCWWGCGWCVVWLVPATPGWGPLAAVVCGVWCVAVGLWLVCGVVGPRHSWLGSVGGGGVWCVVCWWGCGWCVVWLVPRHSWRRFLCATPRHSWPGFAAARGGRSPPLPAGVRWRRWCVVCGGGVLLGLWLVCGVVGPSPLLAEVPRVLLPATPGWVSLPVVVGGPRHSWLGSVGGGGVWCVVCGVLVGSLATPGGGSCVLLPATPGWVSLPVVVGGPRHSWLGSAGGGGVWCVVCACFAWPGRAGRPPGRVLVRLTFSFGRFVFLLSLAPSGLGLPPSFLLLLPFLVGCFSRLPAAWLSVRSRLAAFWWLLPRPPPLLCLAVFVAPAWCLGVFLFFFLFFFVFLCAPPLSPAFSGFRPRVPWASALCIVCFVGLPLLGSPCACPSFVLSA